MAGHTYPRLIKINVWHNSKLQSSNLVSREEESPSHTALLLESGRQAELNGIISSFHDGLQAAKLVPQAALPTELSKFVW